MRRATAASRDESHPGVGPALVRPKTERQLAIARDQLGLNFRGRRRKLSSRESILGGLYPLKNTEPCDGEK
jgi:hypothetical protein